MPRPHNSQYGHPYLHPPAPSHPNEDICWHKILNFQHKANDIMLFTTHGGELFCNFIINIFFCWFAAWGLSFRGKPWRYNHFFVKHFTSNFICNLSVNTIRLIVSILLVSIVLDLLCVSNSVIAFYTLYQSVLYVTIS